jgi:isopenicillin-N epimerase
VKIDLDQLDCDFYVSNLHKWFCAPKGCCFLYLKDKKRLEIGLEPNFISHGYKKDMSYNFCQSKIYFHLNFEKDQAKIFFIL